MMQLVFFLEEPSARAMLEGVLPRLLPAGVNTQFVVFEGKQDLEKRLPKRLRGWRQPNTQFVVMRDQDSGDCRAIKAGLVAKCNAAGHPETLVRIACRELESFYLGDLAAVAAALGPDNLAGKRSERRFRNPDRLGNPAQELKKLAPTYQKLSGSRAIGTRLDVEQNQSHSFRVLVCGIRKMTEGKA